MAVQRHCDGQWQQPAFVLGILHPGRCVQRIATQAHTERLPKVGHLHADRQRIRPACVGAPQLQTRHILAKQPVEVVLHLQHTAQMAHRQGALVVCKRKTNLAEAFQCMRRVQGFDAHQRIDALLAAIHRHVGAVGIDLVCLPFWHAQLASCNCRVGNGSANAGSCSSLGSQRPGSGAS